MIVSYVSILLLKMEEMKKKTAEGFIKSFYTLCWHHQSSLANIRPKKQGICYLFNIFHNINEGLYKIFLISFDTNMGINWGYFMRLIQSKKSKTYF